jgi:hypothetical protein
MGIMASEVVKSVTVTFYKGAAAPQVKLTGIWTRRDIDATSITIRRHLPKHLAELRAKIQKESEDE